MKYILLSGLLLLVFCSYAQNMHPKDTLINGQIYSYVEEMPESNYDLGKYLSHNLRYPDSARVHNISGRVILKFVVNEDGSISDCEVVKSIDKDLDEEALRVVKKMPPWKPGKQNGKGVKVYFTLPIVFKLR